MNRAVNILILVLSLSLMPLPTIAETRLVMFEEQGCYWCEIWKDEIGVVYDKTTEGQLAPLIMLDIDDSVPSNMKFKQRARYTPTFVLMQDGFEVSRIEGYPGEDFFWGLLELMLSDLKKTNS